MSSVSGTEMVQSTGTKKAAVICCTFCQS